MISFERKNPFIRIHSEFRNFIKLKIKQHIVNKSECALRNAGE